MIKVVIADDEKRFREYMERVLDWEALDFKICGIASNGEQVLELLENVRPDIALLDINMPKMDGLVLTEKLKDISPDTYVVFITGYSEFEYARKAVKLGVSEYLLKPFSKEELSKVMLKLKENILKKKEDEKQNVSSRRIIREEMLNRLVRLESEDMEEIQEYRAKLEQLGCNLDAPFYTVSMIEMDKAEGREILKEDRQLWLFGIWNILEELGDNAGKSQIVFQNYENRLISIWQCESREQIEKIPELMEQLCDLVYRLLGISVTIGVGVECSEFAGIPESCRKAFVSLQNKFILGNRRVILYSKLAEENQKADFYRLDLNEELLINLRRNDRQKVEENLALVEAEMIENHYSMDYANAAIMGILSICLSYIVEMKGNIQEILGKQFSPYQELKQKESMSECFEWLAEVFGATVDYFKRPRSKRADQIIGDVEKYIQEHYSDFELTVEDISEAVFLDISYIRKIFSKYKGYTIQEYITAVRMRAAKEKLEQQNCSISEIAEQCGYLDAGYFSKCFKKYYHVSPRQYLNQLQDH